MTSRPHVPDDAAELYDWLAANGIDEWLPENPIVVVADGQITYTALVFEGDRGWSADSVPSSGKTEDRTVPLIASPTDRVRFLATVAGLALIEHP